MYAGTRRNIKFHQHRVTTTNITSNFGRIYRTQHLDFLPSSLLDGSAVTGGLREVKTALELIVNWLIRADSGATEWLESIALRSKRAATTSDDDTASNWTGGSRANEIGIGKDVSGRNVRQSMD